MNDYYVLNISDIKYELDNKNNTLSIKKCYVENCENKNIVIPDTFMVDGIPYTVTTLGKGCFEENFDENEDLHFLLSIVLPNTIKTIRKNAFQNCNKLKSINLPEGLENIGENAFSNCENMNLISPFLPNSLKSLGKNAFGNTAIDKIVIPDSITILNEAVFSDCSFLKNVSLGKNLIIIKDYAFSNCFALENVFFHSNKSLTLGFFTFMNSSCNFTCFFDHDFIKFDFLIKGFFPHTCKFILLKENSYFSSCF